MTDQISEYKYIKRYIDNLIRMEDLNDAWNKIWRYQKVFKHIHGIRNVNKLLDALLDRREELLKVSKFKG